MAVNSSNINATVRFRCNRRKYKNIHKQDKFKDYDFEGSTMSVLIDTLTYATHISECKHKHITSELFLDSTQIRKNVVSRAKDLGFVP